MLFQFKLYDTVNVWIVVRRGECRKKDQQKWRRLELSVERASYLLKSLSSFPLPDTADGEMYIKSEVQ